MICVALLNGTYTIRIESVIRMYMWIIRIRIQPKCHRSCVDKNGFDVSNVLTPSLSLSLSVAFNWNRNNNAHTLDIHSLGVLNWIFPRKKEYYAVLSMLFVEPSLLRKNLFSYRFMKLFASCLFTEFNWWILQLKLVELSVNIVRSSMVYGSVCLYLLETAENLASVPWMIHWASSMQLMCFEYPMNNETDFKI